MRTALRGYHRDEVDAFLARRAWTLGGEAFRVPELRSVQRLVQAEPVDADIIEKVQFRPGWRGYAVPEVDDLLDRLTALLRARG